MQTWVFKTPFCLFPRVLIVGRKRFLRSIGAALADALPGSLPRGVSWSACSPLALGRASRLSFPRCIRNSFVVAAKRGLMGQSGSISGRDAPPILGPRYWGDSEFIFPFSILPPLKRVLGWHIWGPQENARCHGRLGFQFRTGDSLSLRYLWLEICVGCSGAATSCHYASCVLLCVWSRGM